MPTKVIKYECDVCHAAYATEEQAERCERVHEIERKGVCYPPIRELKPIYDHIDIYGNPSKKWWSKREFSK